mgnify:CR=1 FL=1
MKKLALTLMVLCFACNAFAVARFATVGVKEGNVRSCGSTKCSVKFKVWKYTPLEMTAVSKDKNWVQVKDFEGYTGWIHKNLLSETPGLSAKTTINIRVAPSTNAAKAWVVQKGFPLKFVKKEGKWLQVTDDEGTNGWVHNSVVWGFLEYRK